MMIIGNKRNRKSTINQPTRSPFRLSAGSGGGGVPVVTETSDASLSLVRRNYAAHGKYSNASVSVNINASVREREQFSSLEVSSLSQSSAHATYIRQVQVGKKRIAVDRVRHTKASVTSDQVYVNTNATISNSYSCNTAETDDGDADAEQVEESVVAQNAARTFAAASPTRTPPSNYNGRRYKPAADDRDRMRKSSRVSTNSTVAESIAAKRASTVTFDEDGDVRLSEPESSGSGLDGEGEGDDDDTGLGPRGREAEQLAGSYYSADLGMKDEQANGEFAEGATDEVSAKTGRVPYGVRLLLLFVLYYGVLSVYILLGGVIMRAFELPQELETRSTNDRHADTLLDFVRNQTAGFWNETVYLEFETLLNISKQSIKHSVRCGYKDGEESWSLINAMFYVGTLVTTIGYGQIAPVTTGGRIMTVLISLIGIPILMLNVAHLGTTISHLIEELLTFLRRRYNFKLLSGGDSKVDQRYHIPLSIAFVVILIYILAMAGIIAAAEEWPFVDAVYFTFITLATVGLGDLVPDHPLLLLIFSVFIVCGLTLVTIFIELFEFQLERRLVSLRHFMRGFYGRTATTFRRLSNRGRNEKQHATEIALMSDSKLSPK